MECPKTEEEVKAVDIRDQVSVYYTSRNGTKIGLIFQEDPDAWARLHRTMAEFILKKEKIKQQKAAAAQEE
ncbi:hypothetical protein J31TS4_18640 [Paenibacillus sp. J31TS4]|uniref:hypothetical protein n=1 Tax=Paenibacillus sp. J31TS4 TaxID=2807195 RepID=UPI001B08002F|nr:hypothetical protein [Paenibacillus sp. J31TS4]GIP38584.1 hypothetical protein J31TS4_18640 [Paenibacillus sp. J31TS4]